MPKKIRRSNNHLRKTNRKGRKTVNRKRLKKFVGGQYYTVEGAVGKYSIEEMRECNRKIIFAREQTNSLYSQLTEPKFVELFTYLNNRIEEAKLEEDVINTMAKEVGGPAAVPVYAEFKEPGPLGLKTKEREGGTGGAVIVAINPNKQAEDHPQVRAGMVLLSVTDKHGSTIKLANMPYREVVEMLKSPGRPITLAFAMPPSPEAWRPTGVPYHLWKNISVNN